MAANATALGVIFPLIAHVSIDPSEQVGSRVSYIYLANIIGSTLGSLLTGFVLMQFIGVANISADLGILGVLAGVLTLVAARDRVIETLAGHDRLRRAWIRHAGFRGIRIRWRLRKTSIPG